MHRCSKALSLLLCVLCIALSACSAPAVQAPLAIQSTQATVITPDGAKEQIRSIDTKVWGAVDKNLKVLPLLPIQEQALADYLNGDGTIAPGLGKINLDMHSLKVGVDITFHGADPVIVVPALVVSAEKWSSIYGAITSVETQTTWNWVQVFHWVNHLGTASGSYYNLSSNAAVLAKLWQAGISGNATIYYLPGTETMQSQYMVVGRAVINGVESNYPWASIVAADSGAPVTAFNTSLIHAVEKSGEAARFLSKSMSRGWIQVSADDLPDVIRSNWGTKVPSLIKIIMWGAGYQLRLYAASAGISIAKATVQIVAIAEKISSVAADYSMPLILYYPVLDPCNMAVPGKSCEIND